MKANDVVIYLLRSPLHRIMGDTLLLTVTGCKTGRKIQVPVGFFQDGNSMWVVSKRDRTWWRNLRSGAPVELRLHGREFHGFGELVLDEGAVAARMKEYFRRLPGTARYFGVQLEDGLPSTEDLARLARERLFVKICLS